MISDIEYLSLCKECDRILLNANKNIVSINFLHLTRENLYFSKLHKLIFSDKNFFFAGVVTIYIRNIFSIFKHFLKSIYSSRESNISGDKSFKYLFISHNTNNNVDCSAKMDSYFGSIIEHLEKNQKVFLLKINHTSKTCINSNEFAYLSNYPGVYLFISILKKLIKEWFAFKVNKEGILERRISIIAKAELLSFGTMRNLYLCSQVDDVIKQIRPNFLVTTYEGHAWERLVFYNSRFIDRKIECIAYQHAPIFKFQHSIKRSFGREYNPDFIITSGIYYKDTLSLFDESFNKKIEVVGSSRHIDSNLIKKSKDMFDCLVAPEGTEHECNIIFSFALNFAKNYNDIKFIFRIPPTDGMDLFLIKNKKWLDSLENVTISKSNLSADISRSKCLLYRGSSVVLNAVSCGLHPIYLMLKNETSIDPLYFVSSGRDIVSNMDEFKHCLKKKSNIDCKDKMTHLCKRMYTPLNVTVIDSLI